MIGLKKICKWLFNYIKLLLLKIEYGKKIKIQFSGPSHPPYVSWKTKIVIDRNVCLVLKNGTYISSYCQILLSKGAKIQLGRNVYIGEFSRLVSRNVIVIGKNTLLANNVSIYDHDHRFENVNKTIAEQGFIEGSIKIGENCWLGTNVVVLKDTSINKNSIVGANAVINGINKISGVYVGIPAKLKKEL